MIQVRYKCRGSRPYGSTYFIVSHPGLVGVLTGTYTHRKKSGDDCEELVPDWLNPVYGFPERNYSGSAGHLSSAGAKYYPRYSGLTTPGHKARAKKLCKPMV